MDVTKNQIGAKLIEGKTKEVFKLNNGSKDDLVYVLSKDQITAGDGVKKHNIEGKAKLATQTNAAIFEFLNAVGVKTAFVSRVSSKSENHDVAFVAKNCAMIPIEWVTRRVATGSYLKRNPHVKEGYRFAPVKLETFFKDDANHDPQWSFDTLIEAKLDCGGLVITKAHVDEMLTVTKLVFELLERTWHTMNHSLIDMKIEFGVVEENGKKVIVVGDVIDNDAWRLWPNGDKRLMLDKQVYRNMDNATIDAAALNLVKENFKIVAERTEKLFASVMPSKEGTVQVGILIGSKTDLEFAGKIKSALSKYGIHRVQIHVCSAHKSTQYALDVIADMMQYPSCKAIIACAGKSNGLGPVAGANTTVPVINCPPTNDLSSVELDIWSSLRLPSGMACPTILGAENGGQCAAHILANGDVFTWGVIRTQQAYAIVNMLHDDASLN